MNPSDQDVVALQLGRPPRGSWDVAARCDQGLPSVIAVAPLLEDGTPFPTTFWLTCPRLVAEVGGLESSGEHREWALRATDDPGLAMLMLEADAAYRAARTRAGGGVDPCARVGVAGQADPLTVKCLHARVAAALGGIDDPVGRAVLERLAPGSALRPCDPGLCRADVTSS